MGQLDSPGPGGHRRRARGGENAALAGQAMALDSATGLVRLAARFGNAKCRQAFDGSNTLAAGWLRGLLFSRRTGDWPWARVEIVDGGPDGGAGFLPCPSGEAKGFRVST